MSDSDNKTKVIVAIIGLCGVIGAAVISNFDKLFPGNTGLSPTLPSVSTPEQTSEETTATSEPVPAPTSPPSVSTPEQTSEGTTVISEPIPAPTSVASPREKTNVTLEPSKQLITRRGYCTFIAVNESESVVNDICSIQDYSDGTYKLVWSSGKTSNIIVRPSVSIDGVPGSITRSGDNHFSIKWSRGKIGFCWDCTP